MKTKTLNKLVVGALLSLNAFAASAQTVTFDFNYLAGFSVLPTGSTGTPVASQSMVRLGSITLTDLADLGLGDGLTGVRTTVTLDNLASIYSGTGALYVSAYELNFKGTGDLESGPGAATNTNQNWRWVSGQNINTSRTDPIEFAEDGDVNGWGSTNDSFEQEINFVASAFTSGESSTIDFLNSNDYNGFSVAGLLGNPATNPVTDALNPNLRPDAFAWLKIRGTNGAIDTGTLGLTTRTRDGLQSLNVLAVAAVPEPETYAMFLAGLGMLGFTARRRKV